jgi:hypothetical protein
MYCPKCSQPQVSDETQFCSRCGFPLNDLKEMVLADGKTRVRRSKASGADLSPRQRGVRQGVTFMLLSIILIPAYILLAALFPANDRLVESSVSDTPFEKISQAVLFTLFMLGLARVLYARLFQRGASPREGEGETGVARLSGSASNYELPPAQSIPVSGFGSWRTDTGEMARSRSAREHTTKSLDKE